MIRSFKYRLHPNLLQEQMLNRWRIQCAQLYNCALEQRTNAWKQNKVSVSKYDQQKQLTDLREDTEWSSVPALVQRSALDRLDKAFSAFFRRVKQGETPGYPRFRATHRYASFSIGVAKITKNRVHIPKLGHVKLNLYRPIEGEIKNVVIRKDRTNRWWCSFACDVGEAAPKTEIETDVGIDLGLTTFAALSTGELVDNPRFYRKSEKILARRQRELSKTKKGSKARESARILVAKINLRIQNQRLDHARKLAADLFSEYDLVAFEDLNVKGLIQGNLSKSISDASWSIFTQCLVNKAENAGKHAVAVNARGTSQECSGCGMIVKKTLSERIHDCPYCGLVIDRDVNAAIVVLQRARLALGLAPRVSFRGKAVI